MPVRPFGSIAPNHDRLSLADRRGRGGDHLPGVTVAFLRSGHRRAGRLALTSAVQLRYLTWHARQTSLLSLAMRRKVPLTGL